MNDPDDAPLIAEFERKGVDEVRMLIHTAGYNSVVQPIARKWLAHRNREAKEVKLSAEKAAARRHQEEVAEQRQWNRSIAAAAWIAAFLAFASFLAVMWQIFHPS